MPIRHAALAALFAVLFLPAFPAPVTGAGTRYEQVGEHYDVSISYPVLHHPAVDADIGRIVWKLTDAFRRVAGHGLPPQSAAGPRPLRPDQPGGATKADGPNGPNGPNEADGAAPSRGGTPNAAPQGAPQAIADIYAPARRDWLSATHRISRPSANAVSVIFEVQTGLWGRENATVQHDLLAVSYDLAAGRRIELDDLFGDDDCADAVLTAHLRRRIGGGPHVGEVGGAAPSGTRSGTSGMASGRASGRASGMASGTVASGRQLPMMSTGAGGVGNAGPDTAETPVVFWLTPRGLMVLPGSCCWQNASVGGTSSSVPGNFPVDGHRTPVDPPLEVEVPIEPLLQCSPHLSYWGRTR